MFRYVKLMSVSRFFLVLNALFMTADYTGPVCITAFTDVLKSETRIYLYSLIALLFSVPPFH